MSDFIGREEELTKLSELLDKKSASLVVIKGRRRIGKSRLLEEFGIRYIQKVYFFSGLPPTSGEDIHSQKNEFYKQLTRQFPLTKAKESISDWGDLFFLLSTIIPSGRTLIVFDEISWMASQDSQLLGKLKNAWDLYFKKNNQLILAICGSASAWIEKNILSSTGFLGRESLTITLEELSLKDCSKFWSFEQNRTSAYEQLKILSIVGGIPRYLEHINPSISAEENIRKMCFDPSGILFNEFEKIFSDLFYPKNDLYKKIVSCLVDGPIDQRALCAKIGFSQNGSISEYLNDLIKSGFISRDFTWNIQTSEQSRLSHYRLKDNYSRFYLKYILPVRARIEQGNMKEMALSSLVGWSTVLGLQVENLVLSNRAVIKKILNINSNDIICDNPFFQRKTQIHSGVQIDYLIQTKYNTLYICEVKYSKNEVGLNVVEEMKEKINRLKIPKQFSYRPILIQVNGVTEALEDSQFFSKIINLTDCLI